MRLSRQEKELLKKALLYNKGQLSPVDIITGCANGDEKVVERLVSKGYIERVYHFKEGIKSTYSITFYTITEKGMVACESILPRLKYYFKANLALIVGIVSIILGIFSGGISYVATKSAMEANVINAGPYIDISDVSLQLIDHGGSIMKDRSWIKGETAHIGSLSYNPARAVLSLKFLNSGKRSGYVKILNYDKIVTPVTDEQKSTASTCQGSSFLVPAEGETGWLCGVDLIKFYLSNKNANIHYDIETFDTAMKSRDHFQISIRCEFPQNKFGLVNATCTPLQN